MNQCSRPWRPVAYVILPAILLAGCGPDVSDIAVRPAAAPRAATPTVPPAPPPAEADISPPVGCPFEKDHDVWEVCYMQGVKVGYAHARIRRVMVDGRPLVELQWNTRLKVVRFGEPVEMGSELTSRETTDGHLVDFAETQRLGPTPVRVEGRVDGGQLVLTKTSEGKSRTVRLDWSKLTSGHQAIEYSLAARPMTPGEIRNLRALLPSFDQVATVRLAARAVEPTRLLHGTYQLLRIDNTTWFEDGQTVEARLWVDRKGEVLKTELPILQQEIFRASRDEALEEIKPGKMDLGLDTLVPLARPLADPHRARRIRYRITLADGDPAGALVAGASQQVKSLGPDVAELTVWAVRPDRPAKIDLPEADRPTLDDVNPNSLVQSDDERVRAMAAEATQGKTDAWSKAVALERYVHETIADKSLSHALASAAEVAGTREGDCTEHAMLLAAMARAAGLPARVAMGLLYFEREEEPKGVFGYHMWTEIYVDDRWIPMDATLGLGGIGAAHLKLAHSNLKDGNALSSFLPVVKVLKRLKIEVLESQ